MKRLSRTSLVTIQLGILGLLAAFLFFLSHETKVEEEEEVVVPVTRAAVQERNQIQRDIYLPYKGARLHMRLIADGGTLVLNRDPNESLSKEKFVEKFHGVLALMQEELYYILPGGEEAVVVDGGKLLLRGTTDVFVPLNAEMVPMQKLRLVRAKEALYDYKANVLNTESMDFERLVASSHLLPEKTEGLKVEIAGRAESAEITVTEQGPQFHAKHLRVTIPDARVL